MIKAILIDLDNTLLETQALYNAAEKTLLQYVAARSGADEREIAAEIQKRKLSLFSDFGYSPAMLPRAFEETLIHFVPAASKDELKAAHRLANRIFEEEAALKEGVVESLRLLADHFSLYLVTVGDEEVQRRRIETLPCREVFRELFIVPDKNRETYLAVLRHGQHAPDEAVMIGDSLRSDIIPALEAGLFAIHIPADNWQAREMQGLEIPEESFLRHRTLREATAFLTTGTPFAPTNAPPPPAAPAPETARPPLRRYTGPKGPGL